MFFHLLQVFYKSDFIIGRKNSCNSIILFQIKSQVVNSKVHSAAQTSSAPISYFHICWPSVCFALHFACYLRQGSKSGLQCSQTNELWLDQSVLSQRCFSWETFNQSQLALPPERRSKSPKIPCFTSLTLWMNGFGGQCHRLKYRTGSGGRGGGVARFFFFLSL